MKEIQVLALTQNIPITSVEDDIIEGQVTKPKGIKQVLWEHGLLNPDITYIAKIKEDDPNMEEKVEYASALADCVDFLSKKTYLMFLGERLGVDVD